MIPKKIHYCWFGGKMPKKIKNNIKQWKKVLPDYTFYEWNETSINPKKTCDFVREAYSKKKWAFVSDYIRLLALIKHGGIYLDTDVILFHKFDDFLADPLFVSHESKISLCTAVIGSERDNPLLKSFLERYQSMSFLKNGKMDVTPNSELLKDFVNNKYGEVSFDLEFKNNEMHVYPQTFFCAKDIHSYKELVTERTICMHMLDASWYSPWHKFMKKCKKCVMLLINIFRKN